MIQFIIGGVAVAAAGIAAYKKYKSSRGKSGNVAVPVSLGRFAIWGRPNVGKSTFIGELIHRPIPPGEKTATGSRRIYREIPLIRVDDQNYRVTEIVDMPGTNDRIEDWLDLVRSHEHVFYLLNLSCTEQDYKAAVRLDLKSTVDALKDLSKAAKRLHIVATHVDESVWKDQDAGQINNILQSDPDFRKLYELIGDRAGYVYAANLTNKQSFNRLLECIVRDCHA